MKVQNRKSAIEKGNTKSGFSEEIVFRKGEVQICRLLDIKDCCIKDVAVSYIDGNRQGELFTYFLENKKKGDCCIYREMI